MAEANIMTELNDLQCLFTWNIDRSKIAELESLPQKLDDRIRFSPRQYHSTYHNILAFLSHLEGKNESALQYLHKAEETLQQDQRQENDFLVTYSSFAWVCFYLKRVDSAQDYLNKVKEIHENTERSLLPIIHGEKGWSFLRLGGKFYDQSRESFSAALEEEPNNVLCNVGYAIVIYRIEDMTNRDNSDVVDQLRKAHTLDPENAEIMVLLALKLQNSRTEEAQNLMKNALRLAPDVPYVNRNMIKYFGREECTAEILTMLQDALELDPESRTYYLHYQIGVLHYQWLIQKTASRFTQCIRHLTESVRLNPSYVYAQIKSAETHAMNHDYTKAEEIFTRMMENRDINESERQHCHTRYGLFCLYKKRDEAKAIEYFKMAYKSPKDGSDRRHAGTKLRQIAERRAREILDFLADEDQRLGLMNAD